MGIGRVLPAVVSFLAAWGCALACLAQSDHPLALIFPEERTVRVRDPSEMMFVPVPHTPAPPTVTTQQENLPPRHLTLDEAIRTALVNAEVVRVLAGVIAVPSGRTVYDTAIANNAIDQQKAEFDPEVAVNNGFNRLENPTRIGNEIEGFRVDNYAMGFGLTKKTTTGGTFGIGASANPTQTRITRLFPDPFFSPQSRSSAEFSYTQPLLQGGGIRANMARIFLARIDTERSFFQYKDSVQELVRGVVQAYWDLVFARTDLWARQQQLDQLQEAYEIAEANFQVDRRAGFIADQARVSLLNAKANVLQARSAVLDREAGIRSILGFPPYDSEEIIPTTPPTQEHVDFDWSALLDMAAQQRPDIIELKLVLEADEQELILANNQAFPKVEAQGVYRWNGLEGEIPSGYISSRPGQFTDWTMAINFSVPLGLRRARAALRSRELLLSRDRANLQANLLAMSHTLAASLRNLDLAYEQYVVFQQTRTAAEINLQAQKAQFDRGRVIFLDVLLAVTDWGNAVSNEAQSLLRYNTLLAELERQTGTILESHGVRFYEERYGTIGPLGRFHMPQAYPRSLPPGLNYDRYPAGDTPAEESFDLTPPLERLPQ